MSKQLLLVAILVSCSTSPKPMHTSLIDITGEGRVVSCSGGPLHLFTVVSHHEAISIGGMLMTPDIGQLQQFTGDTDVTTAVGVANGQSYRLIGEAPICNANVVTKTKEALEDVQALAFDASRLAAELAEARAAAAKDSDAKKRGKPTDAVMHLEKKLVGVEKRLSESKSVLRHLASTPGIMIARWSNKSSGSAGASLGAIADASIAGREDQSGFVILGGLRVVSLVFGEDFWFFLTNLREQERDYIDQMGVTTHLIQAQDVAYTSDLRVEEIASLRASLGTGSTQAIKLDLYWSFLGEYSNSANMPRVKWRREPFCMVCSMDLPGLAMANERTLQGRFMGATTAVDYASFQHWRTVSANVMYLGSAVPWAKMAEHYKCARKMWRSPSCPFCGSETPGWRDANPVEIPGAGCPDETKRSSERPSDAREYQEGGQR